MAAAWRPTGTQPAVPRRPRPAAATSLDRSPNRTAPSVQPSPTDTDACRDQSDLQRLLPVRRQFGPHQRRRSNLQPRRPRSFQVLQRRRSSDRKAQSVGTRPAATSRDRHGRATEQGVGRMRTAGYAGSRPRDHRLRRGGWRSLRSVAGPTDNGTLAVLDPAAVEGVEADRIDAFRTTLQALARISVFISLPLTSLDRLAIGFQVPVLGRD